MCKWVALQEIVHTELAYYWAFYYKCMAVRKYRLLDIKYGHKNGYMTIKHLYIRIRWPGWLSEHYYFGELFITKADRDSLRKTSHEMTLISSASHQMATLLIWPGKIYVNWGIFDKLSMIFLVKICYVSLQVYLNTYNIKNIISWFV